MLRLASIKFDYFGNQILQLPTSGFIGLAGSHKVVFASFPAPKWESVGQHLKLSEKCDEYRWSGGAKIIRKMRSEYRQSGLLSLIRGNFHRVHHTSPTLSSPTTK